MICNKCRAKLYFVPTKKSISHNLFCQNCNIRIFYNKTPQYLSTNCLFNFRLNKSSFELESKIIEADRPISQTYSLFEVKDLCFPEILALTKNKIASSNYYLGPKIENDVLLVNELLVRLKSIIHLI